MSTRTPTPTLIPDGADTEKGDANLSQPEDFQSKQHNGNEHKATDTQSQAGEVIEHSTWITRINRWIQAIGAEESGIERIKECDRTNQKPWSLFIIFFSSNINTATLALGYLGPTVFKLGWWDSFLCILFFNILAALAPALVAQFGHKLGLRTMTVPRYSFGWWPSKVIGAVNVVIQIGWCVLNDLSGATILYDVCDGKLPSAVCVILIGLIAVIIALFGYKHVHAFDKYTYPVIILCFAILAGFGGPHFVNIPMKTGSVAKASVLTFGTTVVGNGVAWVSVAADYTVYMKETTNNKAVLGWAYASFFLSQVLIEALGAALGTLTMSSDPRFQIRYERAGMGGLIGETFAGHGKGVRGLGKLVGALLAFSNTAVMTLGIYSMGLSTQVVTARAVKVPRLIYTFIGGVACLVCAVAGRDELESVMTNFLSISAYYITPFTVVILADCYIFRRGFKYDVEAWNDRTRLPIGIAATVSFILGTLSAVLGMVQEWWIGPIAVAIGGRSGIDISWIIAAIVTIVIYIPGRFLEYRKYKR